MSDPNNTQDLDSSASLTDSPVPETPVGKSCKGRRFSHQEWEAMYQAWKAGNRNQTALARQWRCAADTVHKYIESGLPVNGWPSFRARLQMENQTSADARERVTAGITAQILDEYGKVRQENLQVLRALRAACTAQVQRMIENIKATPWTRMVTVYRLGKEGQQSRETIERPLDSYELASVARAISTALSMAGKMESFWLGGPTERVENIPESEKLSEAEIDYVNDHQGAMPPGMTPEAFLRKMGRTFGVNLAGKEN
jgi:hypothetical protein